MPKVNPVSLQDLIDLLGQNGANNADISQIMSAYQFANEAHQGLTRSKKESFLQHDLAVACDIALLGTDIDTIVAGLLHDVTIQRTQFEVEDVEKSFGPVISSMVKGFNSLNQYESGLPAQPANNQIPKEESLEKIRRAILSIIEGDIRILLIRLADCLEDLRWAPELPPVEQLEIAKEAMDIYAPLANRLGVWQLKWEIEDLSFRYLEPERYKFIAKQLDQKRGERKKNIDQAVTHLRQELKDADIHAMVYGRPKHIYSIHRKMLKKGLEFKHIYDVQALRVIIEQDSIDLKNKRGKSIEGIERTLCYQILGIVHSIWQPVPREFDDYIAAPKANGYQSLHTAVIDPETGQSLEIQIRTQRMHEEAERGIAAHWSYKEQGSRVSSNAQRKIQNLRDLLTSIRENEHDSSNEEILENEILAERIYVFTPNGDVVEHSKGATPIDFAYQIHTDIGHRCRGARINGKMVSLDYQLQSGDRVEIITANQPRPSRDWMNKTLGYTGSSRTRSKIRQWFRNQEKEQNIIQGREVVERELKSLGLSDTTTVADIAGAFDFDDDDQFLSKVGFGDISSSQISGAIFRIQEKLKPDDELLPLLEAPKPKTKGLTVRGMSGLHTKMAKCCTPIPPEVIVGYITRGQGITVHRADCKQLEAITEKERLIEVDWGTETNTYPIPIILEAIRRPKLVDDILNVLRGQQINVPSTKTVSKGNAVFVYMIAEVDSMEQLNWLLKKLENLPYVLEAKRKRWT
ncbi:MAG: bifunctional (p)ppGpp synthetase/guanosine-3',5'-bis(diphosphate) 3'-pyrophosphohydrolase [Chloroflexota bacterium]